MSKVAAVAVPYILGETHFVLMVQTLLSLLAMKHEHELDIIAVVNRFDGPDPDYEWLVRSCDLVERNDKNCLARAWNKGIRHAFERGAEYALVCNLDLLFHPRYLAELVEFARREPEHFIWGGTDYPDPKTLENAPLDAEPAAKASFDCFLIDRKLFERVGEFDEQFEPAYHEDSDMLYRIKLANGTIKNTGAARYHHFDRITIKGAKIEGRQEFLDELRAMMNLSMARYETKWGGLPGKERFITPYGKR